MHAQSLPLPTILAGTTVRIGGVDAPLYFVSSSQINAQVPFEIEPGRASLVVTSPGGSSEAFAVTIQATAPGLFSTLANGRGMGLLFDSLFRAAENLAAGQVLILYATGLGATIPAGGTGQGGAGSEPLNRVVTVPDIYIGERRAQVAYAGLAPGFAGVYQLNVIVPNAMATDRIFIQGPRRSNIVAFPVTYPGMERFAIHQGEAAGTLLDFESVIPTGQRATVQNAVNMGARFFATQGLGNPGTSHVFVSSTIGQIIELYAKWFDITVQAAASHWAGGGTAIAGAGVVFVNASSTGWTQSATFQPKIVVHEYFHLLQDSLTEGRLVRAGRDDEVPVGGPRWLIEGSAEYVGYRAIGDAGIYPFDRARSDQFSQARMLNATLASLETLLGVRAAGPNGGYPLMFAAVDFLLSRSRVSALREFYHSIGDGMVWQDAFRRAFGTAIEEFYRDFETYRRLNFPPGAQILGTVRNPMAQAYPGIHVYACPTVVPGACGYALTNSSGEYFIRVADEIYIVQFGRTPDGSRPDGFYSTSGFTTSRQAATPIRVAGSDVVGISVTLPF